MERENITHICVVQVFCSFNLYIVYSTVSTLLTVQSVLFDYNIKYVLYFANTICVKNG
jgi:hypothetical protein